MVGISGDRAVHDAESAVRANDEEPAPANVLKRVRSVAVDRAVTNYAGSVGGADSKTPTEGTGRTGRISCDVPGNRTVGNRQRSGVESSHGDAAADSWVIWMACRIARDDGIRERQLGTTLREAAPTQD